MVSAIAVAPPPPPALVDRPTNRCRPRSRPRPNRLIDRLWVRNYELCFHSHSASLREQGQCACQTECESVRVSECHSLTQSLTLNYWRDTDSDTGKTASASFRSLGLIFSLDCVSVFDCEPVQWLAVSANQVSLWMSVSESLTAEPESSPDNLDFQFWLGTGDIWVD